MSNPTDIDYLIPPPEYKFGQQGRDYSVSRGLKRYGPLRNIELDKIRGKIFVVAHKSNADELLKKAEDFAMKLQKGATCGPQLSYLGFEKYFKRALSLDVVRVVVDDTQNPLRVAETVTDSVLNHIRELDIPIIIIPTHIKGITMNHYYCTKALLLSKGISTSQVIRYETLLDDQRLCGSLLPISIQIFTKCGGIPYAIARNIGGTAYKTIILGVGITRVRVDKDIEQYMGVTTLFASDGVFEYIDTKLTELDKFKLARVLERSIVESVQELKKKRILSKEDKVWLVVHYSGKEISRVEEEAIAESCSEISRLVGLQVEPSIIKIIDDNIYRVFSEPAGYYPVVGLYVELLPGKLYILNTLGYDVREQRITRKEMPRSLLISVKKARRELIRELLYSVLALARMNFSGAQMFYRRPATVLYSRKAAMILSRLYYLNGLLSLGLNMLGLPKERLWFI